MIEGDAPEHGHVVREVPRCVAGGILMGLANLVPGISGGTMLLAAGVYPAFVRGIAEVSTFRLRRRVLIRLACIIGAAAVAFFSLAGPMSGLVVDHRWIMYSLFIGLTLGGVPLLWELLRPLDVGVVVFAFLGVGVMTVMALAPTVNGDASTGWLMLLLAGIAAASAMVLPGISGGYLLLVLGQYVPILTAASQLKDGLRGDFDMLRASLSTVIPVGLGVFIGVVGVSNLIKKLLDTFKRPTLAVLLGFLVGSVIGLWPFQRALMPSEGDTIRGRVVTMVEGDPRYVDDGSEVETKAWRTATFAPSPLHIAGSLGLILAGLGTSLVISHLGSSTDR